MKTGGLLSWVGWGRPSHGEFGLPGAVHYRHSVAHQRLYQAYYCEENIWHLARELGRDIQAVLIFCNRARAAFWYQRAGQPVIWDYHVVALGPGPKPVIYDLDTTLALPIDARSYLRQTFASMPWPMVRVVAADAYLEHFVSDRSHMRNAHGIWVAPPPPWPCIGKGANSLTSLLDETDTGRLGTLCSLPALALALTQMSRTPP